MKIRNLNLHSKIFLAPMLEPNDIAFRLLCKKAGCTLTWTGMTNPLSKKTPQLADKPILQLFGNSTKGIKDFIKKYDGQVSGWDFNLGCPSKLSQKLKHGAFMTNDIKKIRDILNLIRSSTDKFFSIKLRKSQNTLAIAKLAEQLGIDAISIHARTTSQGYSGEVDYDFALALKKQIKIPIIFSGISKHKNIKKTLKDFDFVMLGRLAIGNPGIFGQQITFDEYLRLANQYKIPFRQIKYQAINWTKGIKNSTKIRKKLAKTRSIEDLEKTIKNI
jgi:tRNA-dihydrouridine synthase B